jgi:uncharacterized membrane protein SpoIIM required for sporulation
VIPKKRKTMKYMACIPIIYNTLKYEESKDLKIDSERQLLHEHNRAIYFMVFLFLGITISGVVWYISLPAETVGFLFKQQISTIAEINNRVSANITGFATTTDILFKILFNNIKVLIFCVLFSFIYGAGAIFILTWNATVISAAIGNFIKSNITAVATAVGLTKVTGYFTLFSSGFLKYAVHGVPEIMAYFYGGIAGGIISVAIVKNHFATEKASNILLDVGELLLIGFGFLIVGAVFEVYLTPLLF